MGTAATDECAHRREGVVADSSRPYEVPQRLGSGAVVTLRELELGRGVKLIDELAEQERASTSERCEDCCVKRCRFKWCRGRRQHEITRRDLHPAVVARQRPGT